MTLPLSLHTLPTPSFVTSRTGGTDQADRFASALYQDVFTALLFQRALRLLLNNHCLHPLQLNQEKSQGAKSLGCKDVPLVQTQR